MNISLWLELLIYSTFVGLAAAALAITEALAATQDYYEAIKTKEGWVLYLFNSITAGLLIYFLINKQIFDLSLFSAISFIIGYPMLLHIKLFNLKDIEWGLEEIYQKISAWMVPGINDSINEQIQTYLRNFKQLSTKDLAKHTEDYLEVKRGEPKYKASVEADLDLLHRIANDSEEHPDHTEKNNAVIFQMLRRYGNCRAVRHIRKITLAEKNSINGKKR